MGQGPHSPAEPFKGHFQAATSSCPALPMTADDLPGTRRFHEQAHGPHARRVPPAVSPGEDDTAPQVTAAQAHEALPLPLPRDQACADAANSYKYHDPRQATSLELRVQKRAGVSRITGFTSIEA